MTAQEAGAAPHGDPRGSSGAANRPRRVRTPEENVRSLQARIAKATAAGRWNRVKALQYLLTRSQSARVLAAAQVSQNDGSKTPGVDGAT